MLWIVAALRPTSIAKRPSAPTLAPEWRRDGNAYRDAVCGARRSRVGASRDRARERGHRGPRRRPTGPAPASRPGSIGPHAIGLARSMVAAMTISRPAGRAGGLRGPPRQRRPGQWPVRHARRRRPVSGDDLIATMIGGLAAAGGSNACGGPHRRRTCRSGGDRARPGPGQSSVTEPPQRQRCRRARRHDGASAGGDGRRHPL